MFFYIRRSRLRFRDLVTKHFPSAMMGMIKCGLVCLWTTLIIMGIWLIIVELCPVGCYQMPQLVVFSIQHIPTCANIHKKWLRKRKNPKTASWSSLALKMCTWGSGPSTSPLGVTFDPEIENLCGNHMLWTFSIFCWKKFCYSFFRLYLVKLVHFSGFCPF